MDYTKLNDINYYIKYSIEDTEGFDFDGGEKYGGTTVLFFPNKEEVDKFAALPAIGNRTKWYGVTVMDYEKGDVLRMEVHKWDGSLVTDEEMKGKTILMLYDTITNGKLVNSIADVFRKNNVSEVYAYASRIDDDVLDKNNDVFMSMLDNGVVGQIFTKDTALYEKHQRLTLIDEPFFDYFNI